MSGVVTIKLSPYHLIVVILISLLNDVSETTPTIKVETNERRHQAPQIDKYPNNLVKIIRKYPFILNTTSNELISLKDYFNIHRVAKLFDGSYKEGVESYQYEIEQALTFFSIWDRDRHSYTNRDDLLKSGEPVANATLCDRHLNWIHSKLIDGDLNKIYDKNNTNYFNLANYLDSFGRPGAASYLGNMLWYGSYEQCLAVHLNTSISDSDTSSHDHKDSANHVDHHHEKSETSDELIKMRYCLGKLVSIGWKKNDSFVPQPRITVGLCLPETCDTLSYERNAKQIESIVLLNFANLHKSRNKMVSMYCLPDERSPLRKFSSSAWAFFAFSSIWILLVCTATLYDYFVSRTKKYAIVAQSPNTNNNDTQRPIEWKGSKITMPMLEIEQENSCSHSDHLEADSGKMQTNTNMKNGEGVALSSEQEPPIKTVKLDNTTSVWAQFVMIFSLKQNTIELFSTDNINTANVNLVPNNILKIILAFIVTLGHIPMAELFQFKVPALLLSKLGSRWTAIAQSVPLTVDTFFLIAGLFYGHNAMSKLQRDKSTYNDLIKPLKYLQFELNLFLKLSPVYMIIYWFVYSVSSNLSSGPTWDYGTNIESYKGLCKLGSSWHNYILYLGNNDEFVVPPCVPPAWFIVTYIKMFLLLPPLTYVLLRFRRYRLHLVAGVMVAMWIYHTNWIYSSKVVDSDTIRTNIALLYALEAKYTGVHRYSSTLYRFSSTLAGVLTGIVIYEYNISHDKKKDNSKYWPGWMRGTGFRLIIASHFLIFVIPFLMSLTGDFYDAHFSDYNSETIKKLIFAMTIQFIQIIWIVVNCLLLARLCTDVGKKSKWNRHKSWIVLSRITYCVYLVHFEVIFYMLYHDYHHHTQVDLYKMIKDFLVSVPIIIGISLLLHIVVRSPIERLVNRLLRLT